jgi:hypothetical protein
MRGTTAQITVLGSCATDGSWIKDNQSRVCTRMPGNVHIGLMSSGRYRPQALHLATVRVVLRAAAVVLVVPHVQPASSSSSRLVHWTDAPNVVQGPIPCLPAPVVQHVHPVHLPPSTDLHPVLPIHCVTTHTTSTILYHTLNTTQTAESVHAT